MPDLTPLQRATDLLLRAICERDDARARELARQSAEAMVADVFEAGTLGCRRLRRRLS